MKRVAMFAAVMVAGCAASQQQFEPTERVQGRTVEGDKVATYPVTVSTGQVGEANVWSRGAHETEGDESVVHLGLDVRNTGAAPIELRPEEVTLDVFVERGKISGIKPADPVARSFAPGQTGGASLVFPLPHGVSPGDVEALTLNWQGHVADQTYAQRTPFVEEPEPVVYPSSPYAPYGPSPYPGPYGPWSSPWGVGFDYGYWGPVYRYYGPAFHGHHHGHGGHHHRHGGYHHGGHGRHHHGGHGGHHHGGHGGHHRGH